MIDFICDKSQISCGECTKFTRPEEDNNSGVKLAQSEPFISSCDANVSLTEEFVSSIHTAGGVFVLTVSRDHIYTTHFIIYPDIKLHRVSEEYTRRTVTFYFAFLQRKRGRT